MLSNTKEESVIITKRLGSSWLKTFTYEELVEATANFSYGSLLGEGGSGKVYKGMLSNGEAVAVKHFKNDRETADNEFLAEIETISRIHHRNIVKLVGYCQNQANKLLVYEFVPNNSLRYHLFENDNLSIDWSIRMKIAVGSAKGLTYLHEECEPRIVHRNINPSNILLDHSFEPKISDFGLAIVFPDSVTEIYEKVMGTIGYLEPEYLQHGKITVKTDVFCYGVVLMELITGKRAVETMDDDLVLSVKSLLKESLETGNGYAFIDPKLGLSYDLDEMHRMIFCAAACVYKPAELRPQMSQIVSALKGNIPVVSIWRPGDNSFLYDRQRYESPARSTGSGTVGTGSGTVGTGAGSVDEIYEDEEYLR
ncbi:hypothetical protein JCGZ_06094 [Jatropha curcas]|uniref:non-specific serine/threonine protein kinase n=2 Tax=Jatropha curcas TaxID=180498 RepID=A0A067KPU0_JATCU|nr:hypothetical protein JCGZ_06094 [Jatropha curcas]